MRAIDCIKTRRSVRKFKNTEVTEDKVKELVEVAAFAPSWKNSQTARYIAVLDKDIKDTIARDCMMGFEKNTETLLGAPALIVLTTVNCRSGYERDGSFTTAKGTHWQSFDAGIAAEAFCLAAHNAGLATVIMGIFDEQKVSEVLGVSEERSISALIALGYADEEPEAPRRRALEELLTVK